MGFLPHVRVGELPSAKKENAKIDAINSLTDRLDSLWTGGGRTGALRVTISNTSGSAVPTGGVLAVTGCRASGSFEKLSSLYRNGSIPLTGGAVSASSYPLAYALEGIPAGKIGRAAVPGIGAAVATLSNSDHQFLKIGAGGLVTTDNGRMKILAKSDVSSGKVFCVYYELAPGHRLCTTSGWDGETKGPSWTANVTISGATVPVKCPLLGSNDTISNQKTVVVSWNGADQAWEVIEAECE